MKTENKKSEFEVIDLTPTIDACNIPKCKLCEEILLNLKCFHYNTDRHPEDYMTNEFSEILNYNGYVCSACIEPIINDTNKDKLKLLYFDCSSVYYSPINIYPMVLAIDELDFLNKAQIKYLKDITFDLLKINPEDNYENEYTIKEEEFLYQYVVLKLDEEMKISIAGYFHKILPKEQVSFFCDSIQFCDSHKNL